MRKAFGLITAIVFIVLVATIGALALSFSAHTNKQVSDVYLKAQAELLARSAVEYAILALSAHNVSSSGNCIEKIEASYGDRMFNMETRFKYIGTAATLTGCSSSNILADNITTTDSDMTVLIDVMVETNATSLGNIEQIRLHRRTLQKL